MLASVVNSLFVWPPYVLDAQVSLLEGLTGAHCASVLLRAFLLSIPTDQPTSQGFEHRRISFRPHPMKLDLARKSCQVNSYQNSKSPLGSFSEASGQENT